MKISDRILNHLQYAKVANGRVGCRVRAMENNMNHAWVSISTKKRHDVRTNPIQEYIMCYEVEYIELLEAYDEDRNGMDVDLFQVKRIHYFNIKSIDHLEEIMSKWIEDFSIVEPISNISYPE